MSVRGKNIVSEANIIVHHYIRASVRSDIIKLQRRKKISKILIILLVIAIIIAIASVFAVSNVVITS